MQNGQQQSLTKSLYGYLPAFTRSVYERKNELTESIGEVLSSTFSKVGEIKTNLFYNIKHTNFPIIPLVQRKQIEIRNDGSKAYLLGQIYDATKSHKFLFDFRNTFWFSYRKGIKEIESDNGWGCMIRTVQMLFAEVLKRNLKLRETEEDQYRVISYFSEQSDGVFSLTAVCEQGDIKKRWTSSIQILGIFKRIIEKNNSRFKFDVDILSTGVVFKTIKSQVYKKYPVLVCLASRVSLSQIPESLRPHYFGLMRHRSWVGTIGGVKGQALYIVGSYDQRLIFLDPHYVQSTQQELQVQTYFCDSPRGINISELSPSICFCYYFEDEKTHVEWLRWISSTCQAHFSNLIFEFMSEEAKARQEREVERREERRMVSSDSDDFEILE